VFLKKDLVIFFQPHWDANYNLREHNSQTYLIFPPIHLNEFLHRPFWF
jgi:hypothetical protein